MADLNSPKPMSFKSEGGWPLSSTASTFPGTPTEEDFVSVKKAEAEFHALDTELKKTLSRARSNDIKRVSSKAISQRDLEKGFGVDSSDISDVEPFDLEATLAGDRATAEAAGTKFKEVGVLWKNLTVRGLGGTRTYVRTFPQLLVSWLNPWDYVSWICAGRQKRGKQVEILKDFRGVLKAGEMILVLGRPGSGCTSFLKVISNQRFGYTGIDGEVSYGPFDANTFAKRYRGESVYNAEDESQSMYPTLTVRQTLAFALDTKVAGTQPAGLTREEFKDKVIKMLLKMFNIENTMNTFVGGPFVRGISGGERKRVSIAEMMITNASVCAWDNPTRGLDASTAVDYVRSIRIFSNIHRVSTFITAYQVSESIYREFDKVMVIDQGRQVYFGPASEARAYFESLGFMPKPRQTTADYLTGCTDPFEREYKDGLEKSQVPTTPTQLADSFLQSDLSTRLDDEMDNYQKELAAETQKHEDFLAAIKQSKRHTSSKSVYSIPFYLQVWTVFKRQFILKAQDKFSLTVSWITVLFIATILSTLWVNLPKTSAGAFTRGGIAFISFLFNGFQAFGELTGSMLGRPVLSKHRAYAFYRPSALWIAQVFVDILFQALLICVFALMVYFSTDLHREPGSFFVFLFVIMSGYLCMTLVFRTVGILSPDFDVAIRVASVMIAFLVLTSGYPIQYHNQQVWLRWIFWFNPVGLGFSSLMVNEFKHLDLECTGSYLIPNGLGYDDINHQVCTLLGSEPGNPTVNGMAYLKAFFGYKSSDLWRNWGIIWVLIFAFFCATIVLGEFINWGASGRTVTVFVKENAERKKLNGRLQERRREVDRSKDNNLGADIEITSKSILTWEHLDYDVPVPTGHKRILNDVFGYVKPGQLTALMGASGAGKTTLLDVLAARKNIGIISGNILIDGVQPGLAFQRGTSYAEQMDVHEPSQTVREALRFSANLRQPFETPQAEKHAYVEEIITLLELEDIADAIIGSPESGLASDQRKLLTIGVELAAKPQLLLFLDEPTSGLDSQSAWNIARFLKKLTAAGQAVLCTIHQPNFALFQQFDRLLLLQKGGECVYFGDIGPDASMLRDYFWRNGAECPVEANPAEWMLDAIGAGLTPRLGDRDWGEVWRDSPEFASVKQEIADIKAQVTGRTSQEGQSEYATPFWHQIKHVVYRQSVSFWRTPNYGFTRFFNHVVIAVVDGFVFFHLDNSRASLQDRIFLIFQFTVLPAIILAQVQPKFAIARSISFREQAGKAYRTIPFAISMVLAEMPYSLLCAVAFFLPIYYIPALQPASSRAGYQFLMTIVMEVFSVSLGQMVASLTPTPKISALFNAPIMITFALFSGVAMPKVQMPKFWRDSMFEIDPFGRLIAGMMVTELHGREVNCTETELQQFTSLANETCGTYMESFFASGGLGYLVDNDTTSCQYCAYKTGDQYYDVLGYSFSNRWRDLGILACYILSSILIIMLATRFINFNKR